MSAPINTANSSACCAPQCSDVAIAAVPGPAGHDGTNGLAGAAGKNAYTTTTASFTMPAVAGLVNIAVVSSAWCANGQVVYVTTAGYFQITNLFDSTHIQIKNLGYTGNAAPAGNIVSPQQVSPAGIKGLDGSAGSTTFNQISPTTTKGDLIVDNGSLNPNASDVRLAVGTNGQALVADSTQPTGLKWGTITPNASVDNAIARFDGTTGTPLSVQTSKVIVTDDGAIQASGSGGNARGSMATDLQVSRGVATAVASGDRSVIAGGTGNTSSAAFSGVLAGSGNTSSGANATCAGGTTNISSGVESFVAGGDFNVASALRSSVLAGTSNAASATNAVVAGGQHGTASGADSAVGGGAYNTASAQDSYVPGGSNGVADKFGQEAHASGSFANPGDAQKSELLWRVGTSDATANVELFLNGSSQRATIATNTTWAFDIITTIRSDVGVSVVVATKGGIQNNGGTVSLIAANTQAVLVDGSGGVITTANLTVDADNTNKALRLRCTGIVATNLRWVSHARLVEVTF